MFRSRLTCSVNVVCYDTIIFVQHMALSPQGDDTLNTKQTTKKGGQLKMNYCPLLVWHFFGGLDELASQFSQSFCISEFQLSPDTGKGCTMGRWLCQTITSAVIKTECESRNCTLPTFAEKLSSVLCRSTPRFLKTASHFDTVDCTERQWIGWMRFLL